MTCCKDLKDDEDVKCQSDKCGMNLDPVMSVKV